MVTSDQVFIEFEFKTKHDHYKFFIILLLHGTQYMEHICLRNSKGYVKDFSPFF